MRDFPSCFGENGVQVSDASSSGPPPPPPATATATAQNLVTCVYQCKLRSSSSFIVTVTWAKTLMGQNLSVEINNPTNHSLCKLEIKPWLFSKKRGYRNLEMGSNSIDFFWDLSSAKFGSSPEPVEAFYFAITVNRELILLLGDMEKEVHKKMNNNGFNSSSSPNPIFISKKEHIFGKKSYATTAQFCGKGQIHDILIECDTINTNDPFLLIRVDGKTVMQVKQLRWKFRGNYTILVDGLPVEVYWDVYSWFFGRLIGGNGVFMFQTCLSAEKLWGSAINWSNSLIKDSAYSFCTRKL
ncbi:hypothetical protein Ccrd_017771 [Cynara cardunculus var. scolymus]|uniref:Uncharacterized protein n=1 Tax=Cynara cardunculus var. scolymus TaxID=59895 RepID=A0A103Y7I0_CYNCS|nr:hypothetical protein Ccrd_017771 [Cynara cardunculus var. scolymus]